MGMSPGTSGFWGRLAAPPPRQPQDKCPKCPK